MRLGATVMSRGISDKIADNEKFAKQVTYFFDLFIHGDWGDVSEDDADYNDANLQMGKGSLMGAYETCEGRIWIMTEHDRSVTTILFPNEY